MARLRHPRIETVVDGVKLRVQLSSAALAAAGDEAEQRRRAIDILKQALFRGRMIAKERLEAGAGGASTAKLLCAIADEVVTALYDFTTVHVFRARNPTEGERLAVMAVGGYGRGSLAPFSDLDLLFLRPYKQTPHAESVIEFMLYALWDLGFKVGHASRTIDECLRLAREDFTIRTALLEARGLAGDEALVAELKRRFREDITKSGATEFVAAKLKERDERHERAGASRYLVEPNVKESKGGLRDLHTLFWIAPVSAPQRPAVGDRGAGGLHRPRAQGLQARLRLPVGGALPPALRLRPGGGATELRPAARGRPAAWATTPAGSARTTPIPWPTPGLRWSGSCAATS